MGVVVAETVMCSPKPVSSASWAHRESTFPASLDNRWGHVPAFQPVEFTSVTSGSSPSQTFDVIPHVDNGRDSEHQCQALLWVRNTLVLGAASRTRGVHVSQ